MAVVSARRTHDGRGSREGGIDPTSATEVWRIGVDSALDTRATVVAALPSIFAAHDSSPQLTLRSADLEHRHKLVWFATLTYSNEPIEIPRLERASVPNPTLRTPLIRWRTQTRLRVATRDANGKPYLNSAGDQLDAEARQREVVDIVVSVTKSVASLPAWILTLDNRINSGDFSVRGVTFPAETLRIMGLEISDEQEENGFSFLSVSFELHYRAEGWQRSELDRGYRRVDPSDSTKRIVIENDDGTRPTDPVLLDGSGGILSNPSDANAVYIDFTDFELASFAPLNSLVV